MSKIRRSHDRLIFNMRISIPGKDGFYIETGPWCRLGGKLSFELIVRQYIRHWAEMEAFSPVFSPIMSGNSNAIDRLENINFRFCLTGPNC